MIKLFQLFFGRQFHHKYLVHDYKRYPLSLLKERRAITENSFLDLVVWELPEPVPGSGHNYKYWLAFVVNGECVLRYDNESGKGDHKHIMETEVSCTFSGLPQLVNDFMDDVEQWRKDHEHSND